MLGGDIFSPKGKSKQVSGPGLMGEPNRGRDWPLCTRLKTFNIWT